MLDVILILVPLTVALVLRIEPLRSLRPLTLPLLLVAVAAALDLGAGTAFVDATFKRWTEVALVMAIGFLIARACLMVLIDWMLVRRMRVQPPQLVLEVMALVVYLILGVVLLHNLGVEVSGLVATSAVVTVVVGFALQQTLGNLLAGLALAWEQRLTTGTWVELGGRVGLIEETGWRSLTLRTRLDERLLVPNSDVAAGRVMILGAGERPAAVAVRLGVAYGVPPDAVKEVLAEVAAGVPGVVDDPPPRILTVEFGDSAVVFECRLWTRTPWRREDLSDQMLTRAHAALARAGMEIPFPQRTLHRPVQRAPLDTVERRRRAIAASDLFGDLPDEAQATLAEHSRLLRFAPGEAVVRAGDASTALYLVAAGELVVELRDRQIGRLRAGDFFGEMAFLTGSRRNATVRAVEGHVEVIEVDDDCLRSVLEQHEDVAGYLAEKMAERELHGETLRDETGAIVGPAGMVAQIRRHLLRIIGRG